MLELGAFYELKKDYLKVLEYFNQTLKQAEASGSQNSIANVYNSLGICYRNQGDNKRAMDYYLRSLEILEQSGAQFLAAETLNNISEIDIDHRNCTLVPFHVSNNKFSLFDQYPIIFGFLNK